MENNKRKYTAIYRWTMKRYIPVSIAYWVLLFLVLPMEELFVLVTTTLVPDGTLDDYLEAIREPQFFLIITMIIVVFFSTIISFIAFSYMHNKRCVDFFGSLPVSRRTMFFSRYFGVITLVVIPLLIDGIIGGILTLSFMGFLEMMGYMLLIILAAVGNVTMIAFISLCSGTISDMVISYLALNVAYPICIAICSLFPMSVVPGVSYSLIPANIFTFFTPIAAPFTGIFSNQKWIFIVWWIVISAVIIFGCYMLCKKRKAETAQNSFTFAILSNIIKFIVCFAAGFGFGWILSYFGNGFKTVTAQYIWFFFGLITGVLVSNLLLHLVFYKGMEYYAKNLILCAIVILCAGGFLFYVTTGMFGYDSYVPQKDEIASVYIGNEEDEFVYQGHDLLKKYSSEDFDIEDVMEIHKQFISEKTARKNKLYPINNELYDEETDINYYDDYLEEFTINISYQLKDGSIVNRSYEFPNEETYNQFKEIKDHFVCSRDDFVKIPNDLAETEIIAGAIKRDHSFSNADDGNYYSLSENDLKRLLTAVKEDYKEHGVIESIEYRGNDYKILNKNVQGYTLGFRYYYQDNTSAIGQLVEVYWAIDETYTRTISVMKELHLTNSEYLEINGYADYYDDSDIESYKTVYFQIPDDWDKQTDIQAMSMIKEEETLFGELNSKYSKCKKISNDVWEYQMPIAEDIDAVMFFQVLDYGMNCTGGMKIPQNEKKNMLKIYSKKEGRKLLDDFPDALYSYEWVLYNEK